MRHKSSAQIVNSDRGSCPTWDWYLRWDEHDDPFLAISVSENVYTWMWLTATTNMFLYSSPTYKSPEEADTLTMRIKHTSEGDRKP